MKLGDFEECKKCSRALFGILKNLKKNLNFSVCLKRKLKNYDTTNDLAY